MKIKWAAWLWNREYGLLLLSKMIIVNLRCRQRDRGSIPGPLEKSAEQERENMRYTHSLPPSPSFDGKGLFGYTFGPLAEKNIDIYYIEVEKGHDTFMISKKITRFYYIIYGNGYFTIDDCRYDVSQGMLVEVPPNKEYSYSGKMKLIVFSRPRWFNGNDKHTKWNPDVDGGEYPFLENGASGNIFRRFLRKSPINLFIRLNKGLWYRLPSRLRNTHLVRGYGMILHRLVCHRANRTQYTGTFFFRNRPMLELMRRLVDRKPKGSTLNVAVLGCSIGAETYSIVATIRAARPDIDVRVCAVDYSIDVLKIAQDGVYSRQLCNVVRSSIFERMADTEFSEMFEGDRDGAVVRPRIREGISWHQGDAGDPGLIHLIGPQDMVAANNFLCHMQPAEAERCLRNIAGIVKPGGCLFVTGIDLDVREKVARDLRWRPVPELIEEIHDGDPSVRGDWPFAWWGLEPLNKDRADWRVRYAVAFRPSEEGIDGE